MNNSMSKRSLSNRLLDKLTTLGSKPQPSKDDDYRTALMNLDDYLAQPEEDRKIVSLTKNLQNFIFSHAEYYHDQPVELDEEQIVALLQQNFFLSTNEEKVRMLARNLYVGTHRTTFIRKIIAKVVCKGINFHGNPAQSLLPEEIILFMTAFENTPRERETAQVDDIALCEWRRLGMFLLSGSHTRTAKLRNTDERIDTMMTLLDNILSPFAKPDHTGEGNGRRLESLRTVLEIATEFGVLLFGQPCGWKLDWDAEPQVIPEIQVHDRPQTSHVMQQVPNRSNKQHEPSHNKPLPDFTSQKRKRRKRLRGSNSLSEYTSSKQNDRVQSLPTSLTRQELSSRNESAITTQSPTVGFNAQQSHPQYSAPYQSRSVQQCEAQSFNQNSSVDSNSSQTSKPDHFSPATQQILPSVTSGEKGEFPSKPSELPNTQQKEASAMNIQRIKYFPALVKERDEYGCRLSDPIVVSGPVTTRIA